MANDNTVKITAEEIEAVRRELQADEYVYSFRKPVEWEGRVYGSLTFAFGSLTGADCVKIERELAEKKIIAPVPHISADFQLLYAVRACREPVGEDMLLALPAKAFQSIMNHAKAYLGRVRSRNSVETDGEYVHEFITPVTIGGREITSLRFDFGRLIGSDCVEIERKLAYAGVRVVSAQVSREYQVQYAIRACDEKIDEAVFDAMSALDFCTICGRLQNFLLAAE